MTSPQRFRNIAIATAVVGFLSAATAVGISPNDAAGLPKPTTVVEALPLSLKVPESIDRFIQTDTIRRGDTLAALTARLGASDGAFLAFAAQDRVARKALQLRAGRTVQAEVDSLGRVLSFTCRTGSLEEFAETGNRASLSRVRIVRAGESFSSSEEPIPLERSAETRSVVITSSLLAATDAAGIPERVAFKVADIFAGDLDMSRDLRKGARLRVVYETVREAGSFDGAAAGRVLAAELNNGGKLHEAIWFDQNGRGQYFTADGRGVRKALLRNPIEFTRVTSGFTDARFHPIFHETRAHRGVDFAAPTGTRIRATGDGVVEFAGNQRGYGNMVVLRHRGSRYTTAYAHLQSFGSGVRPGASISQGDIIGTVGMTGWATGPHLHYELRLDDKQIDPMKVAATETARIEPGERARFAGVVATTKERFAQADTVTVARFE